MADFEPPSFSLGLDLDFDLEPQQTVREDPSSKQAQQSSTTASFPTIGEEDDDFESPTLDLLPQVSDRPKALKRLRRGPTNEPLSAQKRESVEECCNVDDDIEELSSQDDQSKDKPPSTQYYSACNNSKFLLHHRAVLTTQSVRQWKVRKRKQDLKASASSSLETSSNKLMFPKLTVSPLRRFQLLDSDSDDPVSEDVNEKTTKVDSSSKERQSNPGRYATTSEQKRTKASVSTSQTEDLWKDFCPAKSFHIPTPALDEVCEEYFRSVKNKEAQNLRNDGCTSNNKGSYQNSCVSKKDECHWDLGNPLPPSHHYFFHNDPRIQKLVCSRLPYFYPLSAVNNRGNMQPNSSVIDYMSQFSHGESSKQQATRKMNAETSVTRGRKNSKKSNAEEISQGSGSWVNPKQCAGNPKDAGKRRVHAVGHSTGHWYTTADGKRVYVTKNGQELTGRIAYSHYRKESGKGFKKSKKKISTKKKKT